MEPRTLIGMTAILCIANGLTSPALLFVFALWPAWFPTLVVPASPNFILFFASLIVSTGTLLLSALGAALYERINGLAETSQASAGAWLLGAAVLTLPGFLNVAGV